MLEEDTISKVTSEGGSSVFVQNEILEKHLIRQAPVYGCCLRLTILLFIGIESNRF